MNLDDLSAFRQLDRQGMLAQITGLPGQLEQAYELGAALPLPVCSGVERILIAGMGEAATGPDFFAAWAVDQLSLPINLCQDFELPFWARGSRTLVVAVSDSGETEETLALCEQAADAGCPVLTLTTGGRLAELAYARGFPAWIFPRCQISRTAVGWTFGLLHAACSRLGWLPDPLKELDDGLHAMRNAQMTLLADVPAVKNPAKRMAGQMVGRWVAVFSAGFLAPVARRWKIQLNQMAKTWAQVEILPEATHTTLEGLANPSHPLESVLALFLLSNQLDQRNLSRLGLTRSFMMQQGFNTDALDARGRSRYAQLWTSLLFADYTAYFLAMAYGVDPTPTPALDNFQSTLSV
jgi:glucose/mannose-6-phosphate isomerase